MTLALDISNYTSPITADTLRQWAADNVGVVIVQAFPAYHRNYPKQIAQMRLVRDSGLALDVYIYDYLASPDWRQACLDGLPAAQCVIRRIFMDVEDVTPEAAKLGVSGRINALRNSLRAADLYPTRLNPTGVYSARGYWLGSWGPRGGMGNTAEFSDRPLWDAHYDFIPDAAANFVPYGGWTEPTIKQYAGTSTFDGVGGLDLDVLSITDALTLNPPVEITNMAITPGDGMIAQMHAHGDAPLFGHKFFSEVDDTGLTYSVEQCYGAQGLYVSANSSGQWVNAGPF